MRKHADRFEWSGGHPALDLVNTLDERPSSASIENLATYRDLTQFAALAGLVDRRTAGRLQRLDEPRRSAHCARRAQTARASSQRPCRRTFGTASEPVRSGSAVRGNPEGPHRADPGHLARAGVGQPPLVLSGGAGNSPARLRACRRTAARRRGARPDQKMRRQRLRRLLPRHQQGTAPAVVQHEKLREIAKSSGDGAVPRDSAISING